MSCGICAESPGAASPRHGFLSDAWDMAKPLDNYCFVDLEHLFEHVILALNSARDPEDIENFSRTADRGPLTLIRKCGVYGI